MRHNYYHTLKPAFHKTVVIPTINQLLLDSEFDINHGDGTPWVSATGWGGNANPTIVSGRLNFTYVDRTVTQQITINNYNLYSTATLEFAVSKHSAKTIAATIYNILVEFRNGGTVLGTLRYPEGGNANPAGNDWEEIVVSNNLPVGNVDNVLVSVFGRETANWAGQYGPRFDYVKLRLS